MAAAAGDSVKAMMVQDDGSPRACYEPGIGSVLVLSFGPGSELSCLTFHRSGRLVFLSVVGAVKQDGQVARLGPDQYRAPGQVEPANQVHNRLWKKGKLSSLEAIGIAWFSKGYLLLGGGWG